MSTRFYMTSVDGGNAVSPAFDASWEITGAATRRKLYRKGFVDVAGTLTDKSVTPPVTTTQQILNVQFVSDPLPAQVIGGTFSMINRGLEINATTNAHLAYILRVVSNDGTTAIGTLASSMTTATEYGVAAATRIFGNTIGTTIAVTPTTVSYGDRLVLEIGVHVQAPVASDVVTQRFGTSATSDFALTNALTTDLNPWAQLSQDVFKNYLNNTGERPHPFSPGLAR